MDLRSSSSLLWGTDHSNTTARYALQSPRWVREPTPAIAFETLAERFQLRWVEDHVLLSQLVGSVTGDLETPPMASTACRVHRQALQAMLALPPSTWQRPDGAAMFN